MLTHARVSVLGSMIPTVYAVAFFMGMALIMFPAAGNLFKDPHLYALTSAQYGALFLPMIIVAILSSSLSARLSGTVGERMVLLLGLAANAAAMVLLAASAGLLGHDHAAFVIVVLAIAAVGSGFGFTLSALNAYAFSFFRGRSDTAVTALHAFTGIGQAGAPILLGWFLAMKRWWGAPLVVAAALAVLFSFAVRFPARLPGTGPVGLSLRACQLLSPRIWLFAGLVLLYGICEATFGNWSPLYLHGERGLSLEQASRALAVFWTMVTAGRVGMAILALRLKAAPFYLLSPVLIAIAFWIIPEFHDLRLAVPGLAFAGLACSYFFPLTISLASAEAPESVPAVSGLLVAAIMLGTGIGTFAVGAVRDATGTTLGLLFRLSSLYAILMLVLASSLILSRTGRSYHG